MASNITNQMNLNLFNSIFGRKNSRNIFGFSGFSFSTGSWSFNLSADRFTSTGSANQVIQMTVKKMQAAISGSSSRVSTMQSSRPSTTPAEAKPVEPTKQQVDQAVADAGGLDALSKWLVDGKTKINVGGQKVVASVGGSSGNAAATDAAKEKSVADYRDEATKSLSRFGVDASVLDKGGDQAREKVKQAADAAAKETPSLALAVEYALEDAYAKISAWENAAGGNTGADYETQRQTNLQQADSISKQLGMEGQNWGLESLAEDLAVFGMDMTAMSKDPYDLAEDIRTKSKEMLTDLEKRYVGTEAEFIRERNRITGASARLINGLEGSAGSLITASMQMTGTFASARTEVTVGGVKLDANAVIAVGNVIVDPLVLDLNGDGIDLSGAEEGVAFDMNGDGEKTRMGFIRGDDALLFLNSNGDGIVTDGRQLFGNNDGHANGFEALRPYDENGDGVIDENDAIYDQLMLWQEKNEDGVCERGETMTLREAGIKSINLGYQNVREDDGKGNLIGQTGSFTRDDGSEGYAADVWLQEKKNAQPV